MYLMLRVGLLVLALTVSDGRRVKRQGQSCIAVGYVLGTCTAIKDCRVIADRTVEELRKAGLVEGIRITSQRCNRSRLEVCCPGELAEFPTTPSIPTADQVGKPSELTPGLELPTFEDGCGQLSNIKSRKKRIVGGVVTKIGSWPWIALLGYDSDGTIKFNCGGTTISKRHVLTVAHCLIPRSDTLSFVRFGEYNLTTDTETTHVDIKIRKTLIHPSFSRRSSRNNIGLVYLDQDIQFTDKIKPICLPTIPTLRSKNYQGYMPFAAGWGVVSLNSDMSEVLLETQLEVFNNQRCEDAYREIGALRHNEKIDDAYLCAGDTEGMKDTCQGDSGGPLISAERVESHLHQVLIGIVSFGFGCATSVPALYTNVSHFMDWIEENVREPF